MNAWKAPQKGERWRALNEVVMVALEDVEIDAGCLQCEHSVDDTVDQLSTVVVLGVGEIAQDAQATNVVG